MDPSSAIVVVAVAVYLLVRREKSVASVSSIAIAPANDRGSVATVETAWT
jgi:hypothetical protein